MDCLWCNIQNLLGKEENRTNDTILSQKGLNCNEDHLHSCQFLCFFSPAFLNVNFVLHNCRISSLKEAEITMKISNEWSSLQFEFLSGKKGITWYHLFCSFAFILKKMYLTLIKKHPVRLSFVRFWKEIQKGSFQSNKMWIVCGATLQNSLRKVENRINDNKQLRLISKGLKLQGWPFIPKNMYKKIFFFSHSIFILKIK